MHQHIFKVGWLVTKKLRTTTTLYYTIFLPGVFLHEVTLWFIAGILNVRAERAIAWPEQQAVGELKLNFIKLAKNTPRAKVMIINITPLLVGIGVVLVISSQMLGIGQFVDNIRSGRLNDVAQAIQQLTAAPDFWLWVYVTFTIGNTMFPSSTKEYKGRPTTFTLIGIVVAVILLFNSADAALITQVSEPFNTAANVLSGTFAVLIGIDLVVLGVLGSLESIIERVTGDSATFQNGKMITMRREELLKLRQAELAKKTKAQAKKAAEPGGPPSVYRLPFPIPEPPGKEGLPAPQAAAARIAVPAPETDSEGRAGAARIEGTVVNKPEDSKTESE